MKLVKAQLLLYLYDQLLKGNSLETESICTQLNVSKRTFYRYIAEIRAFLCNFYVDKELIFDEKTKSYRLVK